MNLAAQACTYSPMLVMMFLLPGWARKIGKKEVCAWGVAAAAAANLLLFFLRGMELGLLKWVFLALCFVSGVGLTTLVMQLWAMVTDTIDEIEIKTGSRDDVTAYSVFNLFRKVGQVLAAICVNGALLGMDYKYEKGAVQTLSNLKIMYDLGTLIPAIMFGIMAVILLIFYPLSRRKTEELQLAKELKLKEAYENQEIDI
jgi:GPH family glycoside/pentoside/hexuronide:cation symporter